MSLHLEKRRQYEVNSLKKITFILNFIGISQSKKIDRLKFF